MFFLHSDVLPVWAYPSIPIIVLLILFVICEFNIPREASKLIHFQILTLKWLMHLLGPGYPVLNCLC